uniref:Eburicol 14 alpha-demethylase n=1 Tax=Ganoderma boninense TaxID=34458 RepID=A0A5K1K5E3_9APHY
MPSDTPSSLRKSGPTTVLMSRAEARTSFATTVLHLVISEQAAVLRENRFADDNNDEAALGLHMRPLATRWASVTNRDDYADRLWPDTYSIVSDWGVDYILHGIVVIDKADTTGSVSWSHRRHRCRRKVSLFLVEIPLKTQPTLSRHV